MDTTTYVHSLEERTVALERQALKAKTRAAATEQRVEEATHEMREMDGHLVHYFGL